MKLEIQVTQGAIHVNSIHATHQSETAILLFVDTKQKYPELCCYVRTETSIGVVLTAGERTRDVDRSAGPTEILVTLPDPDEWSCVADAARYDVEIALMRRVPVEEAVLVWEDA